MPPLEPLTPERIAELRRMTPQEKLKIAQRMYWDARREKAAELKTQHPDWSQVEVEGVVKRWFLAHAMREC
jgi:Rv0078B-related antitoxin